MCLRVHMQNNVDILWRLVSCVECFVYILFSFKCAIFDNKKYIYVGTKTGKGSFCCVYFLLLFSVFLYHKKSLGVIPNGSGETHCVLNES